MVPDPPMDLNIPQGLRVMNHEESAYITCLEEDGVGPSNIWWVRIDKEE